MSIDQSQVEKLSKLQTQFNELMQQSPQSLKGFEDLGPMLKELTGSTKDYLMYHRSANFASHKIEALRALFTNRIESINPVSLPITLEKIINCLKKTLNSENLDLQEPSLDKLSTVNDILTIANTATQREEPGWMARTGQILIVDENVNTSQALARRLTKHGHTPVVVQTLPDAKVKLYTITFDVLIIDATTTKNNLIDFIKELRHNEEIGYLPLIVIGNPNDIAIVNECLENGAEDFISKPANNLLLQAKVLSSLEKKIAYELRQRRLKEIKSAKEELEKTISEHPDGFMLFDINQNFVSCNQRVINFYPHLQGVSLKNMKIKDIIDLNSKEGIYELTSDRKESPEKLNMDWSAKILEYLAAPVSRWEEKLKDGRLLEVNSYRTPDGGTVVIIKDISKDKADTDRLKKMAYHDSLTGLANRSLLKQRLEQIITSPAPERSAVMFLDLDKFKQVNDIYGHETGDWLLAQVSQRLKRCVRDRDIVARLGGDEFSIILHGDVTHTIIKRIASRIIASIIEPFIKNDIVINIGISVGISIFPDDSASASDLLHKADVAMYASKQEGGRCYKFSEDVETLEY